MNTNTNYTYETEIPDALLADLPEEARDQENINRVSFTYWQTCWKRMKKDKLAMCLTYWITTARMVRGQIFTLREQDYALAAKVCGQTKWQILIHHLIPNSMGSIIVTMTFLIPSAIFEEAFLSFLGIGIQVPKASWGTMCNDAIQYLTQQPWLMIFPALAISITIFSLNFIGDGLRDALDPRINKQ